MTTAAEYDYIVVGGRVAGASTAMLLARSGARVLLLERTAYGSDTVSTHALMRAGVLQLHRWGLLGQVAACGTPPVQRTVFHYSDDDSVHISIRPSPGVPALYAPRRRVLDTVLVDAARAAGAEVRHGTTVTAVLTGQGGRVVGVLAVDRSGGSFEARARVTVGADGIRSTVASAVAAPYVHRATAGGAVIYGYYEGIPSDGYEWAYGPRTAAGLIPTNDGLTCVFVGGTPAAVREERRLGGEDALVRLFAAAAPGHEGRLRAGRRVGGLHGWAGVPGFVRRSWGPGWALVGDSGHFRDPITTHGMTDALRDAELLSDALMSSAAHQVPEAIALAGYQRQRDGLSAALFSVSGRIAAYDWDLPRLRRMLREVSSAMSDEVTLLQSRPDRWTPLGPDRPQPADMPAARG